MKCPVCVCVRACTHISLPDLFVLFFLFLTVPYSLHSLLSIVRTMSLITCAGLFLKTVSKAFL
jgi:hypothetical protein